MFMLACTYAHAFESKQHFHVSSSHLITAVCDGVSDIVRGDCFEGVTESLNEILETVRPKLLDERFNFSKEVFYWVQVG